MPKKNRPKTDHAKVAARAVEASADLNDLAQWLEYLDFPEKDVKRVRDAADAAAELGPQMGYAANPR